MDDSPSALGRVTGIYRALQSAGAAASWALSTYSWSCDGACVGAVPPTAQAWLNVALGLASLPGTIWVVDSLAKSSSGRGGRPSDPQQSLAAGETLARA